MSFRHVHLWPCSWAAVAPSRGCVYLVSPASLCRVPVSRGAGCGVGVRSWGSGRCTGRERGGHRGGGKVLCGRHRLLAEPPPRPRAYQGPTSGLVSACAVAVPPGVLTVASRTRMSQGEGRPRDVFSARASQPSGRNGGTTLCRSFGDVASCERLSMAESYAGESVRAVAAGPAPGCAACAPLAEEPRTQGDCSTGQGARGSCGGPKARGRSTRGELKPDAALSRVRAGRVCPAHLVLRARGRHSRCHSL